MFFKVEINYNITCGYDQCSKENETQLQLKYEIHINNFEDIMRNFCFIFILSLSFSFM